jgi:hypothetical protein
MLLIDSDSCKSATMFPVTVDERRYARRMIRYPRALWFHVIVAVLVGLLLGAGGSLLAMHLSFAHWARLYPHDGQIGLSVFVVGLFSFPPLAISLGIVVFIAQRKWSASASPLASSRP